MSRVKPLELEFKIEDDGKRPYCTDVLDWKNGTRIGEIKWFAPTRQYVFSPRLSKVLSKDNMLKILHQLEQLEWRERSRR